MNTPIDVRIPECDWVKLREMAEARDTTISELIRQFVADVRDQGEFVTVVRNLILGPMPIERGPMHATMIRLPPGDVLMLEDYANRLCSKINPVIQMLVRERVML